MAGRRLDWEKANRRDRQRITKLRDWKPPRERDEDRQRALEAFALKHDIGCFACGGKGNEGKRWAKSDVSKRGPWIICVPCVARGRAKKPLPIKKSRELARQNERKLIAQNEREIARLTAENEELHRRQQVSRATKAG
jgi:hypothetical protein